MRVQIVIGGLLLDPLCNVGANFLIINVLVDWSITNKLLVYLLKLLCGAPTVDWKYFVRLVVTALLKNSFVILWADFMMVNESCTFNYK